MAIEYDLEKNKWNVETRGIGFDEFENLEFNTATIGMCPVLFRYAKQIRRR